MTIKTAVTLATGAAVGFFLGCLQSEDTKGKIVSGIKDKIIYALTREHIRKKGKDATKRTDYSVSYTKYYEKKKKEEPKTFTYDDWESLKKRLFEFKTFDEADEMMQFMKKEIDNYKVVSIADILSKRENCVSDFVLSQYGWDEEDYRNATIDVNSPKHGDPEIQEKWWIDIKRPHAFYY